MEAMLGSGMGMCRCCATEGTFKGLTTSFLWMGEQEIYLEMLRDCLDVTLEIPEEGPECGICEVCITQLRSAVNFKRQVLNTERQFQRMLENNAFPPKLVKEELSMEADEDDIPLSHLSDDDHAQSEGFSSPEYDVAIKAEKADEKKPRKRAKPGSSRGKLADAEPPAKRNGSNTAKVDTVDPSVSILFQLLTTETNKKPNKRKQEIKKEPATNKKTKISKQEIMKDPETNTTKQNNVKEQQDNRKVIVNKHLMFKEGVKKNNVRDIDKHLQNIREILLCTNGTPIRNFDGLGYTCCFCYQVSFPTLPELKKHTLTTHTDTEKENFGISSKIATYSVKLDITGFQCLLCRSKIDSLENMMKHLSSDHGKNLNFDVDNHILPYKYEDGLFPCVLCPKKIEHFKVMMEHLSSHYRNYICKICGATFITYQTSRAHMARHVRGEFPCKNCPKVFDTRVKREAHERLHAGTTKRNKCPICFEKFDTYPKKTNHMVKEHGTEKMYYKCNACGKSFATKGILRTHTREFHLLERGHECQICNKKFYSVNQLKRHLLSHTGIKEFQCEVCQKSYGRKNTLREHMRIHLDERRFKCEHCHQAFVQKCSLKSHLRTHHGIVSSNP